MLTVNKTMYNIYNDNNFWIELIKLTYPGYLKPIETNFNYREIYIGIGDYEEMIDYYLSFERIRDTECFTNIELFYERNKETLKYLILIEILSVETDLIFEVFKLKELYKIDNNYLLKFLLSQLTKLGNNLFIYDTSDESKDYLSDPNTRIINFDDITNMLSYSLLYSDIIFLELIFDFILIMLKSKYKERYREKIVTLINVYMKRIDENFNRTNIEWLLYRVNPYYTIKNILRLSIEEGINFNFLSFIITKLPDVPDEELLNIVKSLMSDFYLNKMTNETYYILNLYLNFLPDNLIEDSIQFLFEYHRYDNILSLIQKYKKSFTLDFLEYLKEESRIKLEGKWSKDLSNLVKYLN